MFKIVRFPAKLEKFFGTLKNKFFWNHFEYFRTLVLLMAFTCERRNVSAMYRFLDDRDQPHRTRFNNFFLVRRWDPEAALAESAGGLIARLAPKKGDVIYLIIDDSKKEKRGGKASKRKRKRGKAKKEKNRKGKRVKNDKVMEGVGYIHDPVSNKKIRGHQYVQAVIKFRGFVIPYAIRLYVKKELCRDVGVKFKKVTQLAAEIIRAFNPPEGVQVKVLFDSYYLCPVVVKACRSKGFRFVSTLKSNRNLFKNGRKLKTGKYGKNLFRNKTRKKGTFRKSKNGTCYQYIDVGKLKVGKLGELHVMFSRRKGEKKIVGLATDDPKLSPKGVLSTYGQRWSIEVFFRDAKQLLGLGQYQNATYAAAVTHLHLVCFAYALLTHIAIDRKGAKGKKKKRKPAASLSTAELQNELRRIVWDDLSEYLKHQPTGNDVVRELGRLLPAG